MVQAPEETGEQLRVRHLNSVVTWQLFKSARQCTGFLW